MAEFKPTEMFQKLAKEHYDKVKPKLPKLEE